MPFNAMYWSRKLSINTFALEITLALLVRYLQTKLSDFNRPFPKPHSDWFGHFFRASSALFPASPFQSLHVLSVTIHNAF